MKLCCYINSYGLEINCIFKAVYSNSSIHCRCSSRLQCVPHPQYHPVDARRAVCWGGPSLQQDKQCAPKRWHSLRSCRWAGWNVHCHPCLQWSLVCWFYKWKEVTYTSSEVQSWWWALFATKKRHHIHSSHILQYYANVLIYLYFARKMGNRFRELVRHMQT